MKRIVSMVLLFFLFGFIISSFLPVQAMDMEKRDIVGKQSFLSHYKLSLLTSAPPSLEITCFDVSENGLMVIGSENGEQNTVAVYSLDGSFKYGYQFIANGTFGVGWRDDNLIIYLVRDEVAATLDANGNVMEVFDIPNTIENSSYWNHTVFAKRRVLGNNKYYLKNGKKVLYLIAPSTYTQLVVEDQDGNITVLYDADTDNTVLVKYILISIFILIGVIIIIRSACNFGKTNQPSSNQ